MDDHTNVLSTTALPTIWWDAKRPGKHRQQKITPLTFRLSDVEMVLSPPVSKFRIFNTSWLPLRFAYGIFSIRMSVYFCRNSFTKERTNVDTTSSNKTTDVREELERQILSRRREFLKWAFVTSAYVTPIVMSFAAADLARASACPGGGNCGKSESGAFG